jgi:hypothetical protein
MLSAHFDVNEFDGDAPIPPACLPVLTDLCEQVLEPTRAQFGVPLEITSGYRPPLANAEAHGQPNSEHIYTPAWCAADFVVNGVSPRAVFDWMRNNSSLPYHQLILEHGQNSTVIHVSVNKLEPGVRSVLEGATHNAVPYIKVDHVDYAPPSNHDDVQDAAAGES